MKILISWSGDLSGQLADVLRKWLPRVVQAAKPYFSPSDIDKGARWASELAKELENTSICIVALTRENIQSSWIMFEAGAISRNVDRGHVCAILFGIEKTDVQGPLAQFQATRFAKAEMFQLMLTINKALGEQRLDDADLTEAFEMWWPRLVADVDEILKPNSRSLQASVRRPERELIEETLEIVRSLSDRIDAIEAKHDGLHELVEEIDNSVRPKRISVGRDVFSNTPAERAGNPAAARILIEFNEAENHSMLDDAIKVASRYGKVYAITESSNKISFTVSGPNSLSPLLSNQLNNIAGVRRVVGVAI